MQINKLKNRPAPSGRFYDGSTIFFMQKNGVSVVCVDTEKRDRKDVMCRKAETRKKVVATGNRRETACKRAGERSKPLCERGGTGEQFRYPTYLSDFDFNTEIIN